MSYDKLANLDSREGFDSLDEFANQTAHAEYNAWLDSHYADEQDEDLWDENGEFDDYDDVNYIFDDEPDGQPTEQQEWHDFDPDC